MRASFLVMMILAMILSMRLYQLFFIGSGLSEYYSSSLTGRVEKEDLLNETSTHHHHHPSFKEKAPSAEAFVPTGDDCFRWNSEKWLQSPRRGNIDQGMDDAFVLTMIRNASLHDEATMILGTSLCHANSRFRNIVDHDNEDERTIRLWAVRLVYLAFHYHQHHWAIPEAIQRYESTATKKECNLEERNMGTFDFECPDAKFLLVPLRGHGLGANIRTDIIPALLVALVSNRVAVFVNHAPEGDVDVRNPWPLASCDRKDYQCFYLPETPCSLTLEDIRDAHVFYDRVDFRRALKRSILPSGCDDKKVWLFKHTSGHTVQLPELAVARLQNYSNLFLDHLSPDDDRLPVLRKAVQAIGDVDPPREGLNYAMANLKVHHALGMYAMRPSIPSTKKLNQILQDVLPDDLDPERTVGLPVRGSDKCRKESECISFELHMQAAVEVWDKLRKDTKPARNPTLIFTSESRQAVAAQQQFLANNSSLFYQQHNLSFDFVVNTHDVTPDTGYLPDADQETFSADDAMLSAVSSFQLQLLAKNSVGNCCSHFHHLLNDFLMEGCGAAHENHFMCLQESSDPLLHVCCAWHKECKQAKALQKVSG